jgi:hypothetical protein
VKLFFAKILTIIFFVNADAQVIGTVKYIWQNEATKINASVEVYNTEHKKNKGCIYFITNVDTAFNSKSDSLFKQFIISSTLQYNVVKVSFYNVYDSSKLSFFSKELMDFILPDISKKYKFLDDADVVISGINNYALVALHTAINYSDKINKTALFFNDYQPDVMLCATLESSSKLIKGKLFMYVNTQDEEGLSTDSLAEKLALNSSILLYKYDDVNAHASQLIFTEAYNWLMADGNNYVLKTDN